MSTPTRDRLIRTAHDLFHQKGFHTVGIDEIIAAVGVTKTTFYNHFRSKDDLVIEVLQWHDRWWRDTFRDLLRRHGGDTPRGQLESLWDALEEILSGEDYNGCFFINVAVQFPLPHDPAHQAACRHKQAMEWLIRELAGYAGARDPAALAAELSLLMEGAYVTRQVTGSPHTTAVARRIAADVLRRHLP
jgi:AcrR family transcriptional regulator